MVFSSDQTWSSASLDYKLRFCYDSDYYDETKTGDLYDYYNNYFYLSQYR